MRRQPLGCRLQTLSSSQAKALTMVAAKPLTCFAPGTLLKIFIFQADTWIARGLSEFHAALLSCSLRPTLAFLGPLRSVGHYSHGDE
jgi:hypothetical protein